jgi:hypothetical protein
MGVQRGPRDCQGGRTYPEERLGWPRDAWVRCVLWLLQQDTHEVEGPGEDSSEVAGQRDTWKAYW